MNAQNALEQYQNIIPMAQTLYARTESLARTALLPLFLLSIGFAYTKDFGLKGTVVSRLRNLVWTVFLLLLFPKLAAGVRLVGQDIAMSIDNMQGFDDLIKAAKEKSEALKDQSGLSLLGFAVSGILVWVTYFFLYLARYLLLAFYQFYWAFLYILGPFFVLGTLFDGGAVITKNLFKSIVLISAWPIVWSIFSALLKGLPFANAYAIEGSYVTVCAMNVILAISMLMSPFILSFLVEGIGGSESGEGAAGSALKHIGVSSVAKMGEGALFGSLHTAGKLGRKAISSISKKAATKFRKKITLPTPKARVPCILLLLCSYSLAHGRDIVNVHPGKSTLVCLSTQPNQAVLSSVKFFDMSKVGSRILVTSLDRNKNANLLLFYGKKIKTIELTSDPAVPHQEKFGCDAVTLRAERVRDRVPSLRHELPVTLGMKITYAQWSNATRDYFNMMLEIMNDPNGPLQFDWNSLCIQQDKNVIHFSKVDAKRPFLPASARMPVFVEFTRPSLLVTSDAAVQVQVQTNKGLLSAILSKEMR